MPKLWAQSQQAGVGQGGPGTVPWLLPASRANLRKVLAGRPWLLPPAPHPRYIQRRSAEVMGAGKTSQYQGAVRHPLYKPQVVDTCDMIPFPPLTHTPTHRWTNEGHGGLITGDDFPDF